MKQKEGKIKQWNATHQCKINHIGSSESMDTASALRIFKRPCSCYKEAKIQRYAIDDLSTYSAFLESKPYGQAVYPTNYSVSDISRSESEADCEN